MRFRSFRASLLGSLLFCVGCTSIQELPQSVRDESAIEIPPQVIRFYPSKLHLIAWRDDLACARSRLSDQWAMKKFGVIRWYVAEGPWPIDDGDTVLGLFVPPRTIIINRKAMADTFVIAHELLHYLIEDYPSREGRVHPREYFWEMCKLYPLHMTEPRRPRK